MAYSLLTGEHLRTHSCLDERRIIGWNNRDGSKESSNKSFFFFFFGFDCMKFPSSSLLPLLLFFFRLHLAGRECSKSLVLLLFLAPSSLPSLPKHQFELLSLSLLRWPPSTSFTAPLSLPLLPPLAQISQFSPAHFLPLLPSFCHCD